MNLSELQTQIVGLNEEVPLLDGSRKRYINFDNASSTPVFQPVQDKVNEFFKWYSNIHRGIGFKSQLASWVFDEAREIVTNFVKADASSTVIFCKNTTEAINKLAARFRCPAAGQEKPIILTTIMEHHSNELPWRKVGNVIHVGLNTDGSIDVSDLNDKLNKYKGKIQLVAVSGASNVTGFINPIHDFAARVHKIGAEIVVDGAQLAPHRPIDIKPKDDPQHIDYLIFSAHKMYAPFGIGVLVANRGMFEHTAPDYVGGGVVDYVTLKNVYWKDLPEREEAGTPAIIGVVALAKVIKIIEDVGFESIINHETQLTTYALKKLSETPEIVIYGDKNPNNARERLGVIAFNVKGMHHALVSAILSYEGGIGVRNGCFCAHPYVIRLLDITDDESEKIESQCISGDRSGMPGAIRISFSLYNQKEEIDHLCDMLKIVINKSYKGTYELNKRKGEYYPVGFKTKFSSYFEL